MKKTLILLGLSLVAAVPVFAQHNEVDLLVGGAKAMKTAAGGKSEFQHGFEEISYGVSMEQDTIFKIKLGRMNAKTAFVPKGPNGDQVAVDENGQVDYADAVVEYRFSEPFGSTGLFAGTGLYRQSGSNRSETDYGFIAGVNGLFPITRSVGISAEAAYHWAHFYTPKPRYAAIGVGLRFSF
jgi:hypothetical protein